MKFHLINNELIRSKKRSKAAKTTIFGQMRPKADKSAKNGQIGHVIWKRPRQERTIVETWNLKTNVMAKQCGPIPVEGTIDGVTYYKMGDKYYVRAKTSINRKRIKSDPAFARFRANGAIFGQASSIASKLYKKLPKAERQHGLFGKLTAEVKKYLQQGYTANQILKGVKQPIAITRKKVTLTFSSKTVTPSPTLSYADQVIAKALQTLQEIPRQSVPRSQLLAISR